MDYGAELRFHLWLTAGVFLAVVLMQWVKGVKSVGLPVLYLFQVILLHWFGAWIHSLPWFTYGESYFAWLGFRECAMGIVAFGGGNVLTGFLISKWIGRGNESRETPRYDEMLPKKYLIFGFVFFLFLAPALRFVPSIGAVSVCGVSLIIAGLCLACWQEWQKKNIRGFHFKVVLAAGIPLITVAAIGFIGFGVMALLIVYCFVWTFYRPRWLSVVAMAVIVVMGLSFFVTYMRDRNEIRAVVWGGGAYSARGERLLETITDFEFFDYRNMEHLERVDMRLNQNGLVGRAVDNLSEGVVEFAHGKTIEQAFLALVPRILWPNKPVRAGSPEIVAEYTGQTFAKGTSVGVGQVMEFYINFGRTGVLIGFFIFGIAVKCMDYMAATRLHSGNWIGFVAWFMPGIALMNPGGSLVEVFGTFAASIVLMFFINRYALNMFFKKPHERITSMHTTQKYGFKY